MKTLLLLGAIIPAANAALASAYLRDLMTETTSRSYEKDPTTGLFRCEPGFTGSDCTQLKCPYSMSFATSNIKQDWVYTPSTASLINTMYPNDGIETAVGKQLQCTKDTTFDNQHAYRECGGRGLCDRTTGECKCFPSFTGEGCRRTTCPNDCSGHGQCRTDANSFYYLGQTPKVPYGSNIPAYSRAAGAATWGIHWPWLKYQQCHCDAGYEGDDCSLRQCPKGDDPETDCKDDRGNDVQLLKCDLNGGVKKGFFQLRFIDQFGGEYDTRPILIDTDTMSAEDNANSVQDALEALPNFAIPEVEVDVKQTTKAKPEITVTFMDGHNTGKQSLLQVISKAGCESGSQPLFRVDSKNANGDITCTVTREDPIPAFSKYRESATCSNRGICDQSTGLCNCFDGYFGLACDHVNTYI